MVVGSSVSRAAPGVVTADAARGRRSRRVAAPREAPRTPDDRGRGPRKRGRMPSGPQARGSAARGPSNAAGLADGSTGRTDAPTLPLPLPLPLPGSTLPQALVRRGGRVAEGTRLLSEYGVHAPSRVRIPPSPLARLARSLLRSRRVRGRSLSGSALRPRETTLGWLRLNRADLLAPEPAAAAAVHHGAWPRVRRRDRGASER